MFSRFTRSRPAPVAHGRRWRAGLLALCAAMPLLIFGVVSWYDRASELRTARQAALATAYTLAEHADAVFSAIDIALLQLDVAIEDRPFSDVRTDGRIHQMLVDVRRRLPPLESVFLVDENGSIAASSRAFPMPPYDVQHREYFTVGKAGHEGLFLSVPFRGELSRSVSFTASRPITRQGTFRGIVAVTIFPEYFHSLYRGAFLPESHASAALMRKDGMLIFRSPNPRVPAEPMLASSELVEQTALQSSGLITGKVTLDTRPSLTAFRTLPTVPLTLVYAVNETDLLSAWYGRLVGYGIAAACASGALAAGGALVLFGPARRRGVAADEEPPFMARDRRSAPAEPASGVERGVDTLLRVVLAVLAQVRRQLPNAPQAGERPAASIALQDAVDGAVHGVSAAQRLVAGARTRGAEARIVNVETALAALRKLMTGAVWPPPDFAEAAIESSTDVFVDPARFDLALLDLALGLKEIAPAGARLKVKAVRRAVRTAGPEGLEAGDYVAIDFELDNEGGASRTADVRGETRLRLVARFAAQSDGMLVLDEERGAPARATLWLPAALIKRDPSKI
ncbi:cache domain-containing protein [Aquabacter sp. CN5-332]|uniref:cache domain-containing protein n=1 Tax=Aquabacter sp. CN5-332 TaxID=3156608 RepID=UPI0032B57847